MTDHFFEPGAEYDDATGYSAPETIRTFRCVAVAALPDTGEPVAFGFMYSAALGWGGTGMGIGHWRRGWNRTSPVPEREPSEGLKALAEANERELDRQAALYRQLARIIRDGIAAGQWQPGEMLPSEAALRAEHEVSASTVRQALATLRAEGLITVRNGIGSFVADERERRRLFEIQDAQPSLSALAPRLREHGLTEAAEFFESAQPVTPRDRVVGRGELGER